MSDLDLEARVRRIETVLAPQLAQLRNTEAAEAAVRVAEKHLNTERTRAAIRENAAIWGAVFDEALDAADIELGNPHSTIVRKLSVSLPSKDKLDLSRPGRFSVAAFLIEMRCERDASFAEDAMRWLELSPSQQYRRLGLWRGLVEQHAQIKEARAATAAPQARTANTNMETI